MTPPSVELTGLFYHGTRRSFEQLQPSPSGEFGPGIYLTSFQPTAWWYASRVAQGDGPPRVAIVRVDVSKPFVVDKQAWLKATANKTPRTVAAALAKRGYDAIVGIALNGVEFQLVVWDPAKVRLVGWLSPDTPA